MKYYKPPRLSESNFINDLHAILNSDNTSHLIALGDFNVEWRTGRFESVLGFIRT
jgi:hypothetical protein